MSGYFHVVSTYEMMSHFGDKFPKIIPVRKRLPGTAVSNEFDNAKVMYQRDRLFTELKLEADGSELDLNPTRAGRLLGKLLEYIQFCEYILCSKVF